MNPLRYVVTGTGRSGTVYLANLLTRSGIPCGHESLFTPWGLPEALARLEGRSPLHVSAISLESCGSWCQDLDEIVADSSYMAAPFLNHPVLAGVPVLHIVRDPMQVINSFIVGLNYFQDWVPADVWQHFIYTHVPELRLDHPPLERAALYYVRWNQLIEKNAADNPYFFCQLEQVTERLFDYLGARCPDEDLLAARTVNSRMQGKQGYTFDDLPAGPVRDELAELAERYGYSLRPPRPPAPGRGLWRRLVRSFVIRH